MLEENNDLSLSISEEKMVNHGIVSEILNEVLTKVLEKDMEFNFKNKYEWMVY